MVFSCFLSLWIQFLKKKKSFIVYKQSQVGADTRLHLCFSAGSAVASRGRSLCCLVPREASTCVFLTRLTGVPYVPGAFPITGRRAACRRTLLGASRTDRKLLPVTQGKCFLLLSSRLVPLVPGQSIWGLRLRGRSSRAGFHPGRVAIPWEVSSAPRVFNVKSGSQSTGT